MTGTQKTQAMGTGGAGDAAAPDGVNDATGGGNSGGNRYANPHTGKTERGEGGKMSGIMGHGGQSEMGYHGHGQLGDEAVEGGNANAVSKDAESE